MTQINWDDAENPLVKLFVGYDVEGYVEEYELCLDDGYYTPNEQEKTLLVDAIYGVVSDIHEKLRALLPSDFDARIRSAIDRKAEPVAWLRHGEEVPVQNVPFGAMWISDKDDPRAFPVYATPPQARAEHLEDALRHITLVRDEVSDERFRVFALSKAHAALSTPPAAPVTVVEGWKMVPVEPTRAMIDAAYEAHDRYEQSSEGVWCGLSSAYRAMLSAAPEPVTVGESRDALTVIDPDQWEPCSPSYLSRGGCCATAPRVWNSEEGNHWHPKLGDSRDTLIERLVKALELAEGRLDLLLRNYPDESETCDHPVATKYVLSQVRAAIASPALAAKEQQP